jgi:hypothetical protein
VLDPGEIADNFNQFFTNVASSIVEELHPCNSEIDLDFVNSMEDATSDSLNFEADPLTHSEIVDAISQLNDKLSLDENGLSSNFIKKLSLSISTPLLYIFSKSFQTGTIPSDLKISKIIPLHKSGDCSNMDNYRPIAKLNVFSKI